MDHERMHYLTRCWFINGHRKFEIRGGPEAVEVEGKFLIDANTMKEFELVKLRNNHNCEHDLPRDVFLSSTVKNGLGRSM